MKTKIFLLSGILGIALAGAVFTGCKKDSTASTDTDITAAEDDATASNTANDAKSVSDAAMQTNGLHSPGHSPFNFNAYYNATITWARDTTHGTGDTLYIVFPSTPTLCGDGKFREGEIIVYWPYEPGRYLWQAYADSGILITEQFRGYAVGATSGTMTTVSGSRTWTNEGQNENGYENWSFTANLTLTYSTGKTATWNSNRNNVLTEVSGTWYYEITGEAYGTARNGVGYTLTITSPLYVTAVPWWLGGCAWIESGTINVNRTGDDNTLTVNFGTLGNCHNTATATINGNNYTFTEW